MSARETLLELAARCEREDGGFNLDKDILRALGYTWRGMAYWYRDDSHTWPHKPSNFTTSLDAAVTLVPEDFYWSLDSDSNARVVGPEDSNGRVAAGYSDTAVSLVPALALCAAALKARAAQL